MSDLLDVGAFRAQLMASSSSAPVSGLGRPSVPLFINPTLPAPKFHAPSYLLHGVPFNALPDESQQFLTRYGLVNPHTGPSLQDQDQLDPETVQLVRQSLTDALFDTVLELTEDIVRAHVLSDVDTLDSHLRTLAYWVSRYIMLADALCWVDITARDGSPHALSVEQADHYRALQITEPVRMVSTRIVDLYESVASMWNAGWRMDAETKAFYQVDAAEVKATVVPSFLEDLAAILEAKVPSPLGLRRIFVFTAHRCLPSSPPRCRSTPSSPPRTPPSSIGRSRSRCSRGRSSVSLCHFQ